MPLIGTDFTDEQGLDPNQNNHGPGTYAPPATTGATSGGSGFLGGSSGQGKTTTSGPTSSGSNYTNLTDYLNANQGAGATMGGAAADIAAGVGKQATGDLGAYQSDATKDATSGTVNVDPARLSGLQGRDVDAAEMAKIQNGITTGAASTITNPDGSQTITGGRQSYNGPISEPKLNENMTAPSVSYTGPSDHTGVTGDTAAAQSSAHGDLLRLAGYGAQAAGGQSGNAALLRGGNGSDGVYSQPSYTTGENNLDAAILGGTTGGQKALSNIGNTVSTGKAAGTTADSAVDRAFQNAKNTTNATAQTYQNAVAAGNAKNTATNQAYQDAIGRMRAQALAYNPTVTQIAAPAAPPAAPSGAGGSGGAIPMPAGPATPTLPGGGSLPTIAGPAAPTIPTVSGPATPAVGGYVGQEGGKAADYAHSLGFADGGEVQPDMFSGFQDDQQSQSGGAGGLLQTAGKLAPLVMMLMNHGGPVPGKAKYPGNNKKNDVVPAMLSKGEIVVPNSVTQAPNAPEKAKEFVAKVQTPEHRFASLVNYMRKK